MIDNTLRPRSPVNEVRYEPTLKPKLPKTKHRPFGSIRCRACNRYGVTSKCPCSPWAHYAVMIQSKRISKERQQQIRRISFATVEEAQDFRKLVAKECFSTSAYAASRHRAYDACRVRHYHQSRCDPRVVLACRDLHRRNDPMLQGPSFCKKRRREPTLDARALLPMNQRSCLEPRFLSTTMAAHPMVSSSYQPAATVQAMPKQPPTSFQTFRTPSPPVFETTVPATTYVSPVVNTPPPADVPMIPDRKSIELLMFKVVTDCLEQRKDMSLGRSAQPRPQQLI